MPAKLLSPWREAVGSPGVGSWGAGRAGAVALGAVAWLATIVALPSGAGAQSAYPTRPVSVIISAAPGSATDIVARIYLDKLGTQLGQPFVANNRSGASGVIALSAAAAAPTDCYTLLVTTASPMTLLPHMPNIQATYDVQRDFRPISLFTIGFATMSVVANFPAKTLAEFIDYAKKHPEEIKYGSDGTGTLTHLSGELLKQRAGIKMLHVPYRGTADMLQGLLSGNINLALTGSGAVPLARAGQTRILAVLSPQRFPGLPEIPTALEGGVTDVTAVTWFGLFAPSGCSADIADRLSTEVRSIASQPEIKERLMAAGQEAAGSTPAELRARIAAESKQWGDFIRSSKIDFD